LCLFFIWSVGCYECHRTIFWFMLMGFQMQPHIIRFKSFHQVKW
jgi:hypothetical protein